jgi:hypothetical protein
MTWFGGESPEQKRQRRLAELLVAQSERFENAMSAVRDAVFELQLQSDDLSKSRDVLPALALRLDALAIALSMASGCVSRAQLEQHRLEALEARSKDEGKR